MIRIRACLLFLLITLSCGSPWATGEQAVRIGVLAFDGIGQAIARWQPLADYLSREIPGHRFEILPLTHEGLRNRIRKQQLDFVLTNPAHYAGLEVDFHATRIATLRNRHGNTTLTRFGAVIFTRADSPIRRLQDLRGQRLAAVNPEAFGGFLLARKRLIEAGFDPLEQMRILWLGFPQREIVQSLLAGRADAGTVRTGVIEQMIATGTLRPGQLRILGERHVAGFPLRLSTGLYPEWPFARLPHTDEELARQVTLRLLQMPADSAVARATRTAGWTIPLNYDGVHQVLRELRIAPYVPRPRTLADLWRDHGALMLALVAALLLGLVVLAYILRMHRALRASHRALMQHRDQLEDLVEERTRALISANEELRDDIEARMRHEEALQGGCECLQGVHALIVREDLGCEQRIQSILDLLAQGFGARQVLMSQVRADEPRPCAASPPLDRHDHPLVPELARRAITEGEVITRRPDSGDTTTLRYLACPVMRQGRVTALLELLVEDAEEEVTRLDMHSELGLRILQLVAQWLAYEDQARCHDAQRQAARRRLSGLTPREHQVLLEVARGHPNKRIARHLGISIKTAELHRSNLTRKLEVNSAVELTRLAMQAGLLEPEEKDIYK